MAQVRVQRRRVGDDVRVQHPGRVPDLLDLVKDRDDVRAIHPGQQLRAGPAVTVLPGDRAAQPDDKIRGLLHEGPEAGDAAFAEQVEVHPHVHAAFTEVAV